MLQQPKDSFSIKDSIKIFKLKIPSNTDIIVFGKGQELPAYTLKNALVSIKGNYIEISNIYDFLFLESPYTDISRILGFLGDENELHDLVSGMQALGIGGVIYFCGRTNYKPSTSIIELRVLDIKLCEINVSLSLLNTISEDKNKREISLIQQINDLSDLENWIKTKSREFDLNLHLILSPIMSPAKSFLERIGHNVSTYFDKIILTDSQIITTGVDAYMMRRISSYLRANGKNVKEVLLDTDPLMAPIYLSMILFYLKEVKEEV
ncbi:hypothetical protein BFU36_10515 [Sulfolobus sp. A20]|uniref:hypothetical protein n=1 Tax=Sulfolobaceae TaxID=118883 RepID=UPI000863B7E8|nr:MULTISPECIES: hypothetical protein [unclassified Sulfolobus]AOL17065.1 hypothetical protein BFU36_10515 [Sulfolobus sp. A20]